MVIRMKKAEKELFRKHGEVGEMAEKPIDSTIFRWGWKHGKNKETAGYRDNYRKGS